MAQIDEKQRATADWLSRQILAAKPDRNALWHLAGTVGSGKTSVLRLVAESLRSAGLLPVMVGAPGGEVDAAPIALLEMAAPLKAAQHLNGETAVLRDPRRTWAEKMDAITTAVNNSLKSVVLLCDEPTRWYHREESLLDDTPDYCARSLAEWIARDACCRRVISGRIPDDVPPRDRTMAPRLDDGRDFLAENEYWGETKETADVLRRALSQPVPFRSLWEMKLCVALCRFKPIGHVATQASSDVSATALLDEFLDLLEEDRGRRSLCAALARLAIARTPVPKAVFAELTRNLPPLERSIVDECLCDWEQGRVALHPLVRCDVVNRGRDPRRGEKNLAWRLSRDERRAVHRLLKGAYPVGGQGTFRDELESLHHDLLSGVASLDALDERFRFVEQLHEIGRTLSYVHHDHCLAVKLFRLALKFDVNHPYSHHYLAFNLDWLAVEPAKVEEHYCEAIRLQSTHPWWWSRWISYLATRGRFREARSAWRDAMASMSVSEYGTPRWLFLSLHRWVARWLLHWAELDFAEEVLRPIPTELAESDTSIQVLWSLLAALREAERGVAVFPLTVPAKDWWSHNPHTDLPLTWKGEPLRSWQPARVQSVDDDSDLVFLVGANRPPAADAKVEYVEIELTRDQLASAVHHFQPDELREGSFVEIGRYAGDELRISLHRATEWRDPQLLPLVPPPNRWFEQAVTEAWASKRGAV